MEDKEEDPLDLNSVKKTLAHAKSVVACDNSEEAREREVPRERIEVKRQMRNQPGRQEVAMTHQANLMYDLLHIEIEKIRRKAIN